MVLKVFCKFTITKCLYIFSESNFMYTHLSDTELLELIRHDADPTAFAAIYHRYSERLVAMAYNRTKDASASQDIVHEAFLSLWKNREATQINTLENYLATAVKFLSINYITRGRMIFVSPDTIFPNNTIENSTEDRLHNKHLLRLVQEETNRLPAQCRVIFRYKHEEGLSIKEIAQKMDISPRTVQAQLYIATSRLRKAVKAFFTLF